MPDLPFTECDKHKFGSGCNQTCSANCLNQTCNHINGRCRNGCLPGYEGRRCNSSEFGFLLQEKNKPPHQRFKSLSFAPPSESFIYPSICCTIHP